MRDPKLNSPAYQADEEHDGKPRARVPVTHAAPEEPDTDPQGGSGIVDFDDGKPAGAEGADAENHGSA